MSEEANGGQGSDTTSTVSTKRVDTDREVELRAEAAARRVEAKQAREHAKRLEEERDSLKLANEKALADERAKGTQSAEKFKKRALNSELKAVALSHGLADADLLPLIHQKYGDKIKIDDEGNIEGIEEAVAAFKAEKPAYFGEKKSSAESDDKKTQTGSSKKPVSDDNLKATNVSTLKKEDYEARKKQHLAKLRGKR